MIWFILYFIAKMPIIQNSNKTMHFGRIDNFPGDFALFFGSFPCTYNAYWENGKIISLKCQQLNNFLSERETTSNKD